MARLSASGRIGQQVGAKPRPEVPQQTQKIQQKIPDEKDIYSKRADEQLALIQKEVAIAQERVKYFEGLAAKSRNQNKDPSKYENRSDRYSEIVRELNSIKQKASTGKYSSNDLISFAKAKANASSQRTTFKRQLKQQAPPQQPQTTYVNPKTGYGFSMKPEEAEKAGLVAGRFDPQTKKTFVSQKSYQQIEQNLLGEKDVFQMSIDPAKASQPQKTVDHRNEWSIDVAPTQLQLFKENVARKGVLIGSLDYGKDWIKSKHDFLQQKAGYYGGLKETELFGETARLSPYLTPAGSYLLMGEAIEGVISPEGKKTIEQRKFSLEKQGISPILAYAPETAMFGLGFASSPFFSKTKDVFNTFGKTEVKVKDLIPEEVLAGKKAFPTADPKTHLDLFKQSGKGFHATSQPWAELKTGAGTSELPGTYISTKVSPHFLRSGAMEGKKFNFLDYFYDDVIYGLSSPGVMEIIPKGFRAGEYTKIPGASAKPHGFKWTSDVKWGVAEVPGMKTEIEAVLRPGTELVKTGGSKFFKYKGKRIPIDTFKTTGRGVADGVSTGRKTVSSFEGSYGGYGSNSLGGGAGYSSILSAFGSAFIPSSFMTGSGVSSQKSYTPSSSVSTSSSFGRSSFSFSPSSYKQKPSTSSSYRSILSPSYSSSPFLSRSKPVSISTKKNEPMKKTGIMGLLLPSLGLPPTTKKKQGYIPQAKSRGRWVSLSRQPMSRQSALGRMSRTVDHTTSAQGRILPSSGKISPITDDYFDKIKSKLRPYKIKKGKRVGLHNRFIEVRSARSDTRGEIQGLSVAKFIKQRQYKQKKKTKSRRKKNAKNKRKR